MQKQLPSICLSRGLMPSCGDMGTPEDVELDDEKGVLHHGSDSKASLDGSLSSSSEPKSSSLNRSRFVLEHGYASAALVDLYEVNSKVVGKGGFGSIRLARLKGGHPDTWDRVVKTVEHRNAKDKATFKREVEILKTLDHPHVCRIYETFEEKKCFHLILEFIDGKDLFDYVFERFSTGQGFHERLAAVIIWQLLQALHYCHARNIIHRDIKPENIMVCCAPETTPDNGAHIKIIDFGLATDVVSLASCPRGNFCGTYAYVSPEVTTGRARASAASDLWAVGLVAHVLLLGDLPSDEVRHGIDPIDLDGAPISREAHELICGLLEPDAGRRLAGARAEMTNVNSWTNMHTRDVSPRKKDKLTTKISRISTNVMASFVTFHRTVMLHKAVITAVAMHLLDSEHVKTIKEQFMRVDYDGNGRISKAEFCQAVAEKAPKGLAADVDAWVSSVFDSIDTDGSGEIEWSEFLTAGISQCGLSSMSTMRAAFHVFDIDRSGRISAQEFARVLEMLPEDCLECMREFDMNGDGEIDFEEFKSILNGTEPKSGALCISRTCSRASENGIGITMREFTLPDSQRRQIML